MQRAVAIAATTPYTTPGWWWHAVALVVALTVVALWALHRADKLSDEAAEYSDRRKEQKQHAER